MRTDLNWHRTALVAAGILLTAGASFAVGPYEYDDFEDGSVLGWQEGGSSPNPPVNVADGGPNGVGDNYLENSSTGGGGSGSKMLMFNNAQWTGDYVALGSPVIIQADMANLDSNPLEMRLAIESASAGDTRYCSTTSIPLPPDGMWYTLQFPMTDLDMVLVGGSSTLDAVMADVTEVRLIHSTTPDWRGDAVVATMGTDNITIVLPIFSDGFESGDTSGWTVTVP